MSLPDFLVIGAPKAGTTALHAALAGHPQLHMSQVKEPKFFLTDGPPPRRGGGPGDVLTWREHVWERDKYEELFSGCPAGGLAGESTPFYLHNADAQRRIKALIPQAKLIVTIRDPVERAHSNWTHLWSAGLEPIHDLVRACEAEPRRAAAGWSEFWSYVGLGRYGEQLQHLYTLFPRDQVLVLRYRDIVDSPAQSLDQVCAFLDVKQGVLTELPRENVTAHPERTLTHRTVSRMLRAGTTAGRHLPGALGTGITTPLERLLQQKGQQRQPVTWEERQRLIPFFEDDVRLLESMLDADFSAWLQPRDRSGGLVGARPAGQRQARNGQVRPD